MIIILSSYQEPTTDAVCEWLNYINSNYIRINDNDLITDNGLSLHLSNQGFNFVCKTDNKNFNQDDVKILWFRKFGLYNLSSLSKFSITQQISKHLQTEFYAIMQLVYVLFENKKWLCKPSIVQIHKIKSLMIAKSVGLDIPNSFIGNEKQEVQSFANSLGALITKPLKTGENVLLDNKIYTLATEKCSDNDISNLLDKFFPSYLQECLDKAYELRVFYLAGKCYTMAIFSQLDEQTKIDFRRYNSKKPNRCVPFILPENIAFLIDKFMKTIDLNTGSIDIVVTKDGRYVFLEVNPIGQFGMVSFPCNYYLEEKVAEYLTKNDF